MPESSTWSRGQVFCVVTLVCLLSLPLYQHSLGTKGLMVERTEGHLVQGTHGQQELSGHKQTSAAVADRKVAGLVERMRGQTRGLLALAGDQEEEEEEEEEEGKKLVVLLKQYCQATSDNLDKLQEEWEL